MADAVVPIVLEDDPTVRSNGALRELRSDVLEEMIIEDMGINMAERVAVAVGLAGTAAAGFPTSYMRTDLEIVTESATDDSNDGYDAYYFIMYSLHPEQYS